jgi:hypothetical protein
MSANLVHRAICAIFSLFLFRVLVRAQIQVDDNEVSAHRLGRRELIHGKLRDQPISQQSALQVIVNTAGYVDSAKAVAGPEEFREEAERIEKGRHFQPSEKDGAAVRAAFTDYVFVVPPEEWASPRVPFPAVQNTRSNYGATVRCGLKAKATFSLRDIIAVEFRKRRSVIWLRRFAMPIIFP